MKSKILFWLLATIIFSFLLYCCFRFWQTDIRMFFITESFIVLTIILFIFLYRRLIKPYKIIADSMDLLKQQDFSTRLRPVADSEANKLIAVFNKMMDNLKEERLQVREKNHFLDLLIQASPQGVIILDFDGHITDINRAGIKLLNITDIKSVMGKKIKDSGIDLSDYLAALKPGDDVVIRGAGITAYRCTRSSFIDKGFNHPFLLIEELTEELLKVEKKSYEGVIRMMAHEVNNSIGAIGSTLNVLSDILKENDFKDLPDVLPAIESSFDRCHHLSKFVSNFAEVVKIPQPHKTDVNLNELAKSVEALTGAECRNRNINLLLDLSEGACTAYIDAIQFEQVLVNIIKNAYEAIEQQGTIKIITQTTPLSITICNNGPEISEEVTKNLFIPFFTTKPTGQGIGLMVVREILRNHQSTFKFYSENGWTNFEIIFQ